MKHYRLFVCVALLVAVAVGVQAQDWKPTKPITIIVPWGAGGSTDQIIRLCAGELEPHLGQKIVVVNQGGAGGSVGTNSVIQAAADGYTWSAGAVQDMATYKILGLLDTQLSDWTIYLAIINATVVSVNPKTPYKTMDDFIKAGKNPATKFNIATAGPASAGLTATEILRKYIGFQYNHLTYDSGKAASVACAAGEAEMVPQLAVEQVDLWKAGKLLPLAVIGQNPLTVKGYNKAIPPITNWLPEVTAGANYFGIWLYKGTPDNVVKTLGKLWDEVIGKSQLIKDYCEANGAQFEPVWGDKAVKRVYGHIQAVSWVYYEGGRAKISPETVGIPKP